MGLEITTRAADRFRTLAGQGKGYPRIEITPGGCNGFSKSFTIGDPQDGDIRVDVGGGCEVLIDPISHSMLSSSVVDFRTDLQGSYFTIEIPEAASTCGCGTSFSL